MRAIGLAILVFLLVILLLVLQFILGAISVILRAGAVVGIVLVVAYVAYELWTGWQQAK